MRDKYTTLFTTKLSYSGNIDGSRIAFGKTKYSSGTKMRRFIRFLLNKPNNVIHGSYIESKNLMLIYPINDLSMNEISAVISHEFLHMVISNHELQTVGLDKFLRKRNKYDLKSIGNGGI